MGYYLKGPRTIVAIRQLHGVLSNIEIQKLVSYAATQTTHEAKLSTGKTNDDVRRSKIFWLPINDDTKPLHNRIGNLVSSLNAELYNFDITMLQPIQYTEYHGSDAGTYHNHLDWAPNTINARKLSLSIQLSDDAEYEGGDLQITTSHSNNFVASRIKGDAVIFPSFLLHGVTPVTKGVRKSLVVWVEGPEWR